MLPLRVYVKLDPETRREIEEVCEPTDSTADMVSKLFHARAAKAKEESQERKKELVIAGPCK